MSIFARRIHFSLILVALIASCAADVALADSPSVTAVLSNSEAGVGETVRLQVRVTGGRNADVPGQIAVDGLEINRTGTSQHFEMNNFNVTSSVIYDYTILPMKTGTFKIPPQTIHVAGKSLSTPELTLHVIDSPNATARSNHGSSHDAQTASASKLVFAELIVPKKTAFVGEMVPVVVRIGFFVTGQLSNLPEIKVQGFTMRNLQGSNQPEIESINGRRCRVLTFKTAIAAIRSGEFEIGPVQANAVVVVARQRPRSPRDIFGM